MYYASAPWLATKCHAPVFKTNKRPLSVAVAAAPQKEPLRSLQKEENL